MNYFLKYSFNQINNNFHGNSGPASEQVRFDSCIYPRDKISLLSTSNLLNIDSLLTKVDDQDPTKSVMFIPDPDP